MLDKRTFGYGHSFGVLCHYYGREAGLELREDIETALEPGMVVSIEPMIMIPEGGMIGPITELAAVMAAANLRV